MTVAHDTIVWAKVKPDAIIPTKLDEDGWYDIYTCFEEEYIEIPPFTVKLIPTGIASAFSSKWRIALGERGSNTKSCLQLMAGKIDSGFRGEWFAALYNANPIRVVIAKDTTEVKKLNSMIKVPYSKAICQAEIVEVPKLYHVEMAYQDLLLIESERGLGCLGSSQK